MNMILRLAYSALANTRFYCSCFTFEVCSVPRWHIYFLSINGPPWIALFVGVQCVAIFVCFHVPKRSSRESELQSNIQFSHKLVCVDGHRSYTCFMHLGYDSCTIPCDVAVPFLGSILIRSFTKCFDKKYRYELFPVTDDIPFTE